MFSSKNSNTIINNSNSGSVESSVTKDTNIDKVSRKRWPGRENRNSIASTMEPFCQNFRDTIENVNRSQHTSVPNNRRNCELLFEASKIGDVDSLKRLIDGGANVNTRDENGCTMLHYASEEGHVDVLKLLLVCGADVDKRNNSGYTSLHWASRGGHTAIVELLLAHGANPYIYGTGSYMMGNPSENVFDVAAQNPKGPSVLKLLISRAGPGCGSGLNL